IRTLTREPAGSVRRALSFVVGALRSVQVRAHRITVAISVAVDQGIMQSASRPETRAPARTTAWLQSCETPSSEPGRSPGGLFSQAERSGARALPDGVQENSGGC